MSAISHVALVGFGEVGQILAADLAARGGLSLTAWDVLFDDPASIPSRALAGTPVRAGTTAAHAVAEADLVICAVTAANTVHAAQAAAPGLAPGTWFVDINSAAPATKIGAAGHIKATGGRYVEAVAMSPIGPKRIATSILLGGPHAAEFLPIAQALGFAGMSVFSDTLGQASAAKMCRSVVIKGIESLLSESLIAARHYGVDGTVLASLDDLFPGMDWPKIAEYMISRSLQHGRRRAEEMREVAVTVAGAGLDPAMSSACAARQDWSAERRQALEAGGLDAMLDALLESIEPGGIGRP